MESEFTIYHGTSSFLFTKLDGINMELYMEETKTIKQATDAANAKVHAVIREIHALQRWDDYVAFEGSHYGIPPVHDKIHRENNCMGVVAEGRYESCRCHSCEDWGGCSNPTGTQHHACEKCGYQYNSITKENRTKCIMGQTSNKHKINEMPAWQLISKMRMSSFGHPSKIFVWEGFSRL